MNDYDFLIVGAGFAGSVCAHLLAERGCKVLVIDKRTHIGGNAYDRIDSHGILIHPYGPHIFHTNSYDVFKFLSKFTSWRFYEHKVLASDNGEYYNIPINRQTINKVFGLKLTEDQVEEYLETKRIKVDPILTSEDLILNSVGLELCEKFFRGYTRKQWDLDLSELSAGVAARIPTRANDDDRYFTDTYQFMPIDGYTAMFERMLHHKNITLMLDTDFAFIKRTISFKSLIYTGTIDSYYEYCYGKLPYRSLRFEHEHTVDIEYLQPVGTVNYPNNELFTRITEFKHLTGQRHDGSSYVKEYSQSSGDPYYPIPNNTNEKLYKKYEELTKKEINTHFVGRLAQYKYLNMDQVVLASFKLVNSL